MKLQASRVLSSERSQAKLRFHLDLERERLAQVALPPFTSFSLACLRFRPTDSSQSSGPQSTRLQLHDSAAPLEPSSSLHSLAHSALSSRLVVLARSLQWVSARAAAVSHFTTDSCLQTRADILPPYTPCTRPTTFPPHLRLSTRAALLQEDPRTRRRTSHCSWKTSGKQSQTCYSTSRVS